MGIVALLPLSQQLGTLTIKKLQQSVFLTLVWFLSMLTNMELIGLFSFLLKLRNGPIAGALAELNVWVSKDFAPCFSPTCLDRNEL